jgi:hypothetical protein
VVTSYIIYPDIFLDALEQKNGDSTSTFSRLFLGELLKEKERVCTKETKKFFGFLSNYHWCSLIEVILDWINKENISSEEVNIIQLVLSSVDRDGIENYPYKENITPTLDLAKDKLDIYDVKIICNNQTIINKLKEYMKKFSHFGNYSILSAKEGYFEIRE